MGIAPVVLFFERDFLPTVLSSDVAAMFDVVQWHGQYGVTPDEPFYAQHGYYEQYPSIVAEIREIAEANGFRGEFWSTEMGWCGKDVVPSCETPEHPWGPVGSDKVAAKYLARAVVMHLGMDIAAGITLEHGPWYAPTQRHLATAMAGAEPLELQVVIDSDATNVTYYGFVLPDGDRMLAVWSDGAAVDDDPGVEATITLPGFAAEAVTGIDVLHGFEQELVSTMEAGDLVVPGVLVKDYPTILRLRR